VPRLQIVGQSTRGFGDDLEAARHSINVRGSATKAS
jgi:hypothetical protein